jgi:branched-subunit amino acid ABC-type transport system permease component
MDLTWDIAGQLAWTGLAASTYYALFAIAFSLVLKVNQVWNFGQAGLMVLSYYVLYAAMRLLEWPLWAAIALALALTIAGAVAVEWLGFRILRRRRSSVLALFIFTIALSQCAIYLAELIIGADPKSLLPTIVSPVLLVGPIVVSHWDLQALAVTAVLIAGLAAFLRFTREGQFLLAVADNPELAEIYGISASRAYAVAMTIAAVLVVAGMYLAGTRLPMYPASPMNQFLVLAVVATILAGLGNVFAAGAVAIGIGLLQSFSIIVISSTWQIMLVYALIFVTILLFPKGIVLVRADRRVRRGESREPAVAAAAVPPETKDVAP